METWGQALRKRKRRERGEYGKGTEEKSEGRRRKAKSSDEVSGDRDGVESLRGKAARLAEMLERCIAERGRKKPSGRARKGRNEMWTSESEEA